MWRGESVRARASVLTGAALGAAVVMVAATVGFTPSGAPGAPPGPATATGTEIPRATRGHDPAVVTTRGPRPPQSGAWLGAWARPSVYGPVGRADAFTEFEQRMGADLQVVHHYREWTDAFPDAVERAMLDRADILMISWGGTDSRSIIAGSYDTQIRKRAEALKAFDEPVLLRFRWEMDRPNLRAVVRTPADFVAAWRHVRDLFTEAGATNVGWVWCPHAEGFRDPARDATAYYPGDDHVDWLCVDVYPGPDMVPFSRQMDPVLAFAQQRDKPLLVGEFGVASAGSAGAGGDWIRDLHEYTKAHPQIKALVYFAGSGDDPPSDTTLLDAPETAAALRELFRDPYFASPAPAGGS
jgi:hypothetical protein